MDIRKIEHYIVANNLLQGGEKVIVGVSGGERTLSPC